jgi:DNA helicase HerA-like ATPase
MTDQPSIDIPSPEDFATLEPGETQITSIPTPDDLSEEDRRNDLSGLAEIPATDPVGLVDASVDASTQRAQILIDTRVDLALDTFVVTPQRLIVDSVLFHYGIVTEAAGRVEGAATATDTARLAAATLPGQRFRRAEVTWIRTHPELYLPPSSGAPVWIAAGEHRRRALFLDKMEHGEELPIGLDMNDEIVFIPYSFLNGDRGAHASISGKSGVATKTSYALFLLYILFETDWGVTARKANAHDRSLLFSVKGSDLCLLDQHNNVFVETDPRGVEAREQWAKLGVPDPKPFTKVAVYAPAEDAAPGTDPVAEISVRPKASTAAYGWSPLALIREGLLEYLFDDLESGQLSFIEQVVRTQLLRWAHKHAGDDTGKVVLADPPMGLGRSWEAALRALDRKTDLTGADGQVIETLDELVTFIAAKVTDGDPDYDPSWTGGVNTSTAQAFVRRLWKATPRLRRLIRSGLAEVDLAKQVSVVDVHALHADAQRFVVAAVLARVWAEHEDSTAAGRTFVVLDELNKYAPRQQNSPIKSLLVDIAARGRSLGVILIGAQQNPSGVDRDITNNAALEVVGQIKANEASELGFLPVEMRARAQIIAPGTMITSQPLLPAPVPIRFPFPPYATRFSEVLASPEDDERGRALLDDM